MIIIRIFKLLRFYFSRNPWLANAFKTCWNCSLDIPAK